MSLIKIEWQKLFHTPLLVASVIAPLLGSLAVLVLALQRSRPIWFDYIAINLNLTHALLIPLVMGLAAAYVFGREYITGTAAGLRLSGYTVWEFSLAKLVVVLGIGALMSLVAIVVAVVSGMAVGLEGFYWEVVLRYAAVSLLSCAVAACSVPIIGAIAVLEKGFLTASVLGAAAALSGVLSMAGLTSRLNPWGLPMLFVSRFLDLVFRDPLRALKPVWPTALVFALVGLVIVAVVQSRVDIQPER